MDLLEYGRTIHAEMSAITDAARLGLSINNAIMYVTTFPCHMCAKHIVASGIDVVKYIEPFPKSYAHRPQSDSISIGPKESCGDKCQFVPFIGISPYRFQDVFERKRRKDTSCIFKQWMDDEPKPIIKYTIPSFVVNEEAVMKIFNDVTKDLLEKRIIKVYAGG
jgi:tRNA(Arg) A34 adenosine deaminase TadA